MGVSIIIDKLSLKKPSRKSRRRQLTKNADYYKIPDMFTCNSVKVSRFLTVLQTSYPQVDDEVLV